MLDDRNNSPPVVPPDEWLNTATHTLGIVLALAGTVWMMINASSRTPGIAISCLAFCVSAILVFVFSTLSHAFSDPAKRTLMRAWDQGTIYLMISGTYTPFAWYFGGALKWPLLAFLWILAGYGLWSKVVARRRVNAVAVTTYILLGWLPAAALVMKVPPGCLLGMGAGGVLYSVGVIFLMNDHRAKYMHAVWHLVVIAAASCHYIIIMKYVVT